MAIRKLDGRKKPFQVYYINPFTGKQTSASYATKKEAEKADALIKFRLKYEKESFKPEEMPEKKVVEEDIPDDSLEAIDGMYLREKRPGIKTLRWHLDGMKIPLEMLARRRIGSITKQDIAQVYAKQQKPNVTQVTIASRMSVFFILLRWAKKRGFLENLPEFPEVPKGENEHFIPPTKEELDIIYAAAPEHIKRVIILGAKLGIRVGPSEMFKLTWEDVDLEKGVVRVKAANKYKAEPWREVPIKDSLMPMFRQWKARDQLAGQKMLVHWRGKGLRNPVNRSWREILKKVGITRKIRPYDLRHAFASDAIAAGADIGTVARLMGHANVTMVLKYYQHVATKQKKATVETLPDIENMTNQNMTKQNRKVKRYANY